MNLNILDIITYIQNNKLILRITPYKKASTEEISEFEEVMDIKLPDDFKTFYSFYNGFESHEDMFRIIPLNEIIKRSDDKSYLSNQKDFHFAEYMIYCDVWTLNINSTNNNIYSIYNIAGDIVTLTNSFSEFLSRFLVGGVFSGLYNWREEIKQNK